MEAVLDENTPLTQEDPWALKDTMCLTYLAATFCPTPAAPFCLWQSALGLGNFTSSGMASSGGAPTVCLPLTLEATPSTAVFVTLWTLLFYPSNP